MLNSKSKIFHNITTYLEGEAVRVALSHSEGVSIYDENAHLLEELSLGNCYGMRRYKGKTYLLCDKSVIILGDNVKVSGLQKPYDIEIVNDELYVADAETLRVFDRGTLQEIRRYSEGDGVQFQELSSLSSLYDELYCLDGKSA